MLRPVEVARSIENQSNARDERVFVKDGFRSYRRTFKLSEVYWGLGTGAVLLGILGWVGWKGAHPDPSLFDISASLIAEPGEAALETPPTAGSRGALPAGLGAGAFKEGKVGEFSSDNLYVKINGRAGYFQSFGVRSLHTITLEAGSGAEGAASIDIELYDLGEARNALGAYNGERPPGVESEQGEGAAFHFDRNAGFLARGNYYARFIGSDESPAVVAEVKRLLEVFRRELPAGEQPWGYDYFVGQLALDAGRVTYVKENAFSFGFARDVYKATLSEQDATDDQEAFIVATSDDEAASALAQKFAEGFGSMGARAGQTSAGVALYEDEFLGSFAAATASDRWVVGLRGAPSADAASELLERLTKGVQSMPAALRARAVPSAEAAPASEEEGVHEY